MRAVTASQIAELDRRATERHGISTEQLMESAGRRVAQAALQMLGGSRGRVVVLAGKGNNGGDGLVAARDLATRGLPVTALLIAPERDYTGEAARTLAEAKQAGMAAVPAADLDPSQLAALLDSAPLIVDALFGTGFKGPAKGPAAALIEASNASRTPVLAVDVPSGLNADTGWPQGPVVRAAATVTMGLPKVGLLIHPGAGLAGTVYVADIGYPDELVNDPSVPTHLVTPQMVRSRIPARPPDAHKGTFGRTLVVAGSVGFTGAAVLAALGALRTGAGLVTLAVPRAIYPIVASHVIEAMPTPVDDEGGAIAASAMGRLDALLQVSDAVAVGPGLSTQPAVYEIVEELLLRDRPLVIDADGLNVLAGRAGVLARATAPVVVTPHPGELGRLVGTSAASVQQDRLGAARRAAAEFRCVVVLKGARTVVAQPGGEVHIVPTGNPGMATGGMGDVLTGAIASFIGQGVPPADAAWVGAYLHGLAADLIADERGTAGMLASEVADRLPRAIERVSSGRQPDPVIPLQD